jgi:hypothetical protein
MLLKFKKIFKNVLVFFWHFFKKIGYQGYKKMPKNAEKNKLLFVM